MTEYINLKEDILAKFKSKNVNFRGVPALYQSLGGSGKGYPDPSSRLASRVELPKITISVVETSPSEE